MNLKTVTALIAGAVVVLSAFGQTPEQPFIRGDLNIRFDTRTQSGTEGVTDKYTLKLNVSNSALFYGTIEHRPFAKGGTFSSDKMGQLIHSIECDVVNPKNPAQTRNVGRLSGIVPIDGKNVYRFQDGNLKIGVFGAGTAKGFDSKAGGLALGKPPAQSVGMFESIKKEVVSLTRTASSGKTVGIKVTNYDKMEFQRHVLSAGPVQIYPEVTVDGVMLYDYDRSAWYLQNITVRYAVDGKQLEDKLTGNIRWVESPNRKLSGEGEYQFDIRVNEPPPNESAVFDGAADEASFFDSGGGAPGLIGAMKYKDIMVNGSPTSSAVKVDLTGNKLTKQQTMYLAKLLLMSCIVPMNSE